MYVNSLLYLSQDLYGDFQWHKLNSRLQGATLKRNNMFLRT